MDAKGKNVNYVVSCSCCSFLCIYNKHEPLLYPRTPCKLIILRLVYTSRAHQDIRASQVIRNNGNSQDALYDLPFVTSRLVDSGGS
jgi:hypothetical protein